MFVKNVHLHISSGIKFNYCSFFGFQGEYSNEKSETFSIKTKLFSIDFDFEIALDIVLAAKDRQFLETGTNYLFYHY